MIYAVIWTFSQPPPLICAHGLWMTPQPLEERNYSEFFYGRESLTVLSWPMLFGILEFSLWCPTKPDPSCCLLTISISWNGTLTKTFLVLDVCARKLKEKKPLSIMVSFWIWEVCFFCLVKGLLDHPILAQKLVLF